ncbi:MAG: ABC transporter substrate-binding protein [Acetobacteraceae bacterium]
MNQLLMARRGFLAGSAALAACPRSGLAAAEAARGGVLRIAVDQAAGVLNPLLTRVNPEYLVAELLYSGLTRLNEAMAAEPDLATSWSANADLTEWTFSLRPNLVFHDGSLCTAKDVAASFVVMLDPKMASPARTNIGPIAGVEAKDSGTVVFHLKSPYADMPVALAYTNARIIPATYANEAGMEKLTRTAVGTGPFTLVSFAPDREVVVARNPRYYAAPRPYLDRVQVLVYPDPTAQASALIAGDIDLMAQAAPAEYQRLEAAKAVKALRVSSGQFLNVNMRCDQKPFDDMRVRQALALTVSRPDMVGFCADGYGTPGNDTPISPAYRFYDRLPLRQPDIARAKALLAAAGHGDGLDLTLIASDTPPTRTPLGVALSAMAKPSGFRIKVQTMPHATYLAQVWKKGKFYVGFYNMQATADAIYQLLYTSDAAWNETRWDNAKFDTLVAAARQTTDEARRRSLYDMAQVLQRDEVPSVIPVFFDLLAAERKWVEGYQLNPRGAVFRLDYVWLGAGAPRR